MSVWDVLDELRKFTTEHYQRKCLQTTDRAGVAVGRTDGAMTLRGTKPCGKRFCPNCAPRIQAARRDEIRECVEAARSMGWTTLFLTLTLAHTTDDRLASLLDALDTSWGAMTRGGFWSRLKRRHGLRHFVRVTECQQGGEHGWHPHVHVLLFLNTATATGYDVAALESSIVREWERVVAATGHRATASAQRLVEPTEEHLAKMSAYFTKQLAEGLAWEMTGQASKASHGSSRNPQELLLLAVAGDPGSRRAWGELEEATKGRRLIAYSAHARRDLSLEPALTVDEIIAAEEARPVPEPLVDVLAEDWREHAGRAGFRSALALVVEDPNTDAESLLWWLHDRGIRASRAASAPPPWTPRPSVPGPPGREWLALPDGDGGFA